MKKFLYTLGMSAVFSLAAAPFMPGSANAGHFHTKTPPVAPGVPCNFAPAINGNDITKVAGGKYNQNDGSTVFTTIEQDDAVVWKVALPVAPKLSTLTALSYEVKKQKLLPMAGEPEPNLAAAAAYRIYLDNGKTLYYEPYYQKGSHLDAQGNVKLDEWFTYDVDAGKFWQTGEGGGSYAGNRTMAEFKTLYPNAKVTHIGVGQGDYNVTTRSRFKNVKFGATDTCTKPVQPSASGSVSPKPSSSSATQPGGVFHKTCADAPHKLIKGVDAGYRPELDSDGDGTACEERGDKPVAAGLPVTGSKPYMIAGLGLLLVLGGGAVTWLSRRKRTVYEA